MTAQIAREGAKYWVSCAEHSWRWEAKGGEGHAINLAAKHDRENHADDPPAGTEDLVDQIAELIDGDLDAAEAIVVLVRRTHAPIPF